MPFWRALEKIATVLRPAPARDEKIRASVRAKLDRIADNPDAISIAVEHGCVELRGPIQTRERARVVREVARVKGVDAIVDLMTEPEKKLHLVSSRP